MSTAATEAPSTDSDSELTVRQLESFASAGSNEGSEESDSLGNARADPQISDGSNSSSEAEPLDDEYDLQDASDLDDEANRSGSGASSASSEEANTEQGKDDNLEETDAKQPADKSMAAAFAEILAHPGPANSKHKAPILLGSKSVSKLRREELETTAAQRAAKKLRQEMKQRGHVGLPKRGENPAADAHEKMLHKIATRGVVQLFNAVSKAQRAQKEALYQGAKAKDAKISKASFFEELRGKERNTLQRPLARPIGPSQSDSALDPSMKHPAKPANGWDVLNEGFAGLQGFSGLKMKDWDKALEPQQAGADGVSGSDSDEAVEW